MNNLIILNKISKSFFTNKKVSVLKKINYKFKKGKIYSLVGPSGSGKSTLLNILSLIDKPTLGMLKINDKLFTYSPQTDRIIQISGHMLRQSVMGSDMSYNDVMEDKPLNQLYLSLIHI